MCGFFPSYILSSSVKRRFTTTVPAQIDNDLHIAFVCIVYPISEPPPLKLALTLVDKGLKINDGLLPGRKRLLTECQRMNNFSIFPETF